MIAFVPLSRYIAQDRTGRVKGAVMANPAALYNKAGMFFVLLVIVPTLAYFAPAWYTFTAVGALLTIRETMWLPRKKWGGNVEKADALGMAALFGLLAMALTRNQDDGFGVVMVVLAGVAGTDTFANIVGGLIGKHHYSKVSKKKTIEGLAGGIIGGALTMWAAWAILRSMDRLDMSGLHLVVVAPFIVAMSILGDHLASSVKRDLSEAEEGIKDFSGLFGSHGGFLDRFDSHVFAFMAFLILDAELLFEMFF